MYRSIYIALFTTACTSAGPHAAPVAPVAGPPPAPAATPKPSAPAPATTPPPETSSASVDEGAKLYDDNGCGACHTIDGTPKRGPTMRGYVGASFVLANGTKVVGSEERFLKSFVHAEPLQGFESSMPSYAEVIDEHDRHALFAYVRSLH